MTLREQRVYFTGLVVRLLSQIAEHKWPYGTVEVAGDEWTVHTPRMVRLGETGPRQLAWDAVHKRAGQHPKGLAVDLLVYIDGDYVESGDHQIWKDIDGMARTMDPEFGLGLAFQDPNHLSYGEGS